ncbi:MAG TPA: DUF4405 domain-containing protein [Burkholderiaceae bacterium]|nr:DUF4405 domain-containing protein [Burkholderiaceae bacterium]
MTRRFPLEAVRLERWHRWSVYGSIIAITVTGLAWLVLHYFGRTAGEFGDVIHPAEPWTLKLHGLGGFVLLFFGGSLLNGHIRKAWRVKRNRLSGGLLAAVLVVLVATGWLLYYAGSPALRDVVSLAHWLIGLTLTGLVIWHVVRGRRRKTPPPTLY